LTQINAISVRCGLWIDRRTHAGHNRSGEMGQKDTTQQTVLLVDDDAALRSSLEFILRIEGYAVRAYSRGRDLLDDTNLPDRGCLVIDQRLPDIEGLKVIDALRARSVRLPAILITTNPTRALQRRAYEANVAIVEKPLITGTLFQRIGAALK
jgi:two-component system, LuxR family, response regulator FixJ